MHTHASIVLQTTSAPPEPFWPRALPRRLSFEKRTSRGHAVFFRPGAKPQVMDKGEISKFPKGSKPSLRPGRGQGLKGRMRGLVAAGFSDDESSEEGITGKRRAKPDMKSVLTLMQWSLRKKTDMPNMTWEKVSSAFSSSSFPSH